MRRRAVFSVLRTLAPASAVRRRATARRCRRARRRRRVCQQPLAGASSGFCSAPPWKSGLLAKNAVRCAWRAGPDEVAADRTHGPVNGVVAIGRRQAAKESERLSRSAWRLRPVCMRIGACLARGHAGASPGVATEVPASRAGSMQARVGGPARGVAGDRRGEGEAGKRAGKRCISGPQRIQCTNTKWMLKCNENCLGQMQGQHRTFFHCPERSLFQPIRMQFR